PVLREFYSERDVVMEERRMRLENQPQGRLYEQLLLTSFAAHPYRVPTVGFMSELEHLTRPQAAAFRARYYVPGHAVGAIVGHVDPQAAQRLLTKYFGDLPSAPAPQGPPTTEPAQGGERRVAVDYDAEPEMMLGFHKAAWPSPDDA